MSGMILASACDLVHSESCASEANIVMLALLFLFVLPLMWSG